MRCKKACLKKPAHDQPLAPRSEGAQSRSQPRGEAAVCINRVLRLHPLTQPRFAREPLREGKHLAELLLVEVARPAARRAGRRPTPAAATALCAALVRVPVAAPVMLVVGSAGGGLRFFDASNEPWTTVGIYKNTLEIVF